MVVGVDDVHLLDELSTFVVHQIVARSAAKVVLTVRDGEPVPSAIQEIWTGSRFDRLDLKRLSLDETDRAVIGGARWSGGFEMPPSDCGSSRAETFCTCKTSSSRRSPTADLCKTTGTGGGGETRSCRPALSSSSNPAWGH